VAIEESIGALSEMRAAGKIRHVGVSNFSVSQVKRARAIVPIVSVQNHYNLGYRQSEPVLDYCERENIGFIPFFPLGFGNLPTAAGPLRPIAARLEATPAQIALTWLFHRSSAMLPIPGTSSIAHLEENERASGIELSKSDFRTLAQFGSY
jgi:pyridoxine 4-dehydrogenase